MNRRDNLEDLSINGKTSEWILGKICEVWTGCIWLRTETNSGLLWRW